jgi:hypothetical protein
MHTFTEKSLNEPAAVSTVTAAYSESLPDCHESNESVKEKWRDLCINGAE